MESGNGSIILGWSIDLFFLCVLMLKLLVFYSWRRYSYYLEACNSEHMWNNGWQTSIAREMTHLSRVIRTLSLIE